MPPKVRDLIRNLRKAGFVDTGLGKGSHRVYSHPDLPGSSITVAGRDGDDARDYLIKEVREKITAAERRGQRSGETQ